MLSNEERKTFAEGFEKGSFFFRFETFFPDREVDEWAEISGAKDSLSSVWTVSLAMKNVRKMTTFSGLQVKWRLEETLAEIKSLFLSN